MNKLIVKVDNSVDDGSMEEMIVNRIAAVCKEMKYYFRFRHVDGDTIIDVSAHDWASAREMSEIIGRLQRIDPAAKQKIEKALHGDEIEWEEL